MGKKVTNVGPLRRSARRGGHLSTIAADAERIQVPYSLKYSYTKYETNNIANIHFIGKITGTTHDFQDGG